MTVLAAAGYVVGPASATDNAFARYDLTTGKLIQNSVVICTDAGAVSGMDSLSFANNKAINFGTSNRHTLKSDGTNLILDPDNFGTGYFGVQGNMLVSGHMAAGSTVIDPNIIINASESSTTILGGVVGGVTHTGTAGGDVYGLNFFVYTDQDQSNPLNVRGINVLVEHTGDLDASDYAYENKMAAGLGVNLTQAFGTLSLYGLHLDSYLLGNANTSAGRVNMATLYVEDAEVVNTGSLVLTKHCAMFEGNVGMVAGKWLLFNSAIDTFGSTYLTSPAGSSFEAYIADALEVTIAANALTFNNGATDTGFAWATSGSLDVTVAAAIEATFAANALTFNNGATDTGFGWATNGQLDFVVGATNEMSLTADVLTFEAGATDVGFGWATSGQLDFRVGSTGEMRLTADNLTFENGASDTSIGWSSSGVMNLTATTVACSAALTTVTAAIGASGAVITKVLTGTATLNFGSIAALDTADLTITVTGANAGDSVWLGVPNGSVAADVSYFAWVSASNTVTVRCSNLGAISADPASGTFRAVVMQF
ncbi:MAG: hypothetical protein ACKV2Q_36555 [Planctomycetaceae bacterium]